MQRDVEVTILELAEQEGVTPEGFEPFSRSAWLAHWDCYVEQVYVAREALRDLPRVSKRRAVGNYLLKHILERRQGKYISPGACIIAALMLGIDVWREGKTRNALIGVDADGSLKQSPGKLPLDTKRVLANDGAPGNV